MFTEIAKGSFISDGLPYFLPTPLGCDYIVCDNETVIRARTVNRAVRTEWNNAMRVNDSFITYYAAGAPVLNMATGYEFPATPFRPGFTPINMATQLVPAIGATPVSVITQYPVSQGTFVSSTSATNPIVTTTAVNIPAGEYGTSQITTNRTVVRLSYPAPAALGAAPTMMGIDYSVTVNAPTSFTLPVHATALPISAGGQFSVVSYTSDPMFYPSTRTVINVTVAANPTVTTSVVHNYLPGQRIRLHVPASCGMIQLDGITANILTTPTLNTFTIDQSTLGFTPFVWPLLASWPCGFASCVPAGKTGTIQYAYTLGGASVSTGRVGVILGAGDYSPMGQANDIIHYRIGSYASL